MFEKLIQEYKIIKYVKKQADKLGHSFGYIYKNHPRRDESIEVRIRPDIFDGLNSLSIDVFGKKARSRVIREILTAARTHDGFLDCDDISDWKRTVIRITKKEKDIIISKKTKQGKMGKTSALWLNHKFLTFLNEYKSQR